MLKTKVKRYKDELEEAIKANDSEKIADAKEMLEMAEKNQRDLKEHAMYAVETLVNKAMQDAQGTYKFRVDYINSYITSGIETVLIIEDRGKEMKQYNIDVTGLSVPETVEKVIDKCLKGRWDNGLRNR